MWVSHEELELFLASPAVDLNLVSLEIPAAPETGPEFPRNTVRCLCTCASLMKTVRRLGVRVDVCPDCHAVWLDGGELLLIANRVSLSKNDEFRTMLFNVLRAGR
jgi:ribosomal protein L31